MSKVPEGMWPIREGAVMVCCVYQGCGLMPEWNETGAGHRSLCAVHAWLVAPWWRRLWWWVAGRRRPSGTP